MDNDNNKTEHNIHNTINKTDTIRKDKTKHNNEKITNTNNNETNTNNTNNETNDTNDIYDELQDFYQHQSQKKPKKNKNHQNNIKNTLVKEIKQENLEISQDKEEKIFIPKNEGVFSLKTFEDLPINEYLKKTLVKKSFETMTKIQKKSIPILLQHKNVIVKSETGSGKTLAYLIPVFEMLTKLNAEKKIDRKDGPYVIILAPTHELCIQIDNTFTLLRSACINAINGTLIVSVI